MRLTLRDKQLFYDGLARLFRSGSTFPRAAEMLRAGTRGRLGRFLARVAKAAQAGDSVLEALAKQRPAVGEMELGIIGAAERSGRLDRACTGLAGYFGALEKARSLVLQRSLYPLVMAHLGIFITAAPKLFLGAGLGEYLAQTAGVLLLAYLAAAVAFCLLREVLRLGQGSVGVDRALRALPGLGGLRASFATARFCATLDAQLEAGVNVLESLARAAQASSSAWVVSHVKAAIPRLQAGASLGDALAQTGAFPREMQRSVRLAEETGELDMELRRLAEDYEQRALRRVENLSDWLPRLIYGLVVLYLGYQMVSTYSGVLSGYQKALDF